MISWEQCAVLWVPALLTFCIPAVAKRAFGYFRTTPGLLAFFAFVVLNAVVGMSWKTVRTDPQHFGFPYAFSDVRPNWERGPQWFSDSIPGTKIYHSRESFSLPSLLGDLAIGLLLVGAWAWPVTFQEWIMNRGRNPYRPAFIRKWLA